MVYVGGAPAGTTLLSANLDSGGTESSDGSTVTYTLGDTLSLTLEFFPGGGLPVRGGGGADAPGHGRHLRRLHPGPGPAVLPLPGRRADGKRKNAQDFLDGQLTIHPHRGDGLPGVTYFSGGKPWRYSSKAPLGSVIS